MGGQWRGQHPSASSSKRNTEMDERARVSHVPRLAFQDHFRCSPVDRLRHLEELLVGSTGSDVVFGDLAKL